MAYGNSVRTVAPDHSAPDALGAPPQWVAFVGERGWLPDIGQISDEGLRDLKKSVKRGELAKYRGHWDTGFAAFGMGPLKTIYALPEVAAYAAELDGSFAKRGV